MFKHKTVMFLYFYIYVSISFFFSPFLIEVKNFDPETIGYLTTTGLIFLIISFLFSGIIADKINSNKKIILINLCISFFVVLGLIFFTNKIILAILYILIWASFIMITSQLDGLVIRDIDSKLYSKVRAFGSYGAAVSYFVNSYALGGLNLNQIIGLNAVLIVIIIIFVSLITETHYQNISIKEYKQSLITARKIKPLIYILIITFLTYGTLSADDSYQVIYNTDVVKISTTIMGIVGFISIVSEGSFMLLHQKIVNKFGLTKTINIGIITLLVIYITRFSLYTSPLIINLGSIFMGVFIGFFVPSAILIINTYVKDNTKNTFLSLYQIMIRLGGALIGLITAIFYDLTGTLQNIYIIHSILIACSLYFVYLLKKELNQTQKKQL